MSYAKPVALTVVAVIVASVLLMLALNSVATSMLPSAREGATAHAAKCRYMGRHRNGKPWWWCNGRATSSPGGGAAPRG